MRFIIGVRRNVEFYWFKTSLEDMTTQMDDAAKFETVQEAQATLAITTLLRNENRRPKFPLESAPARREYRSRWGHWVAW